MSPVEKSISFALRAGIIVTNFLADLAVTAAKLAADAVETAKIKDLAVTYGKLSANNKQRLCKGWARIDGKSAPASLRDSFNVASLTDNGVGDYTLVWDNDFSNINYVTVGIIRTTAGIYGFVIQEAVYAVGSARIGSRRLSGSLTDFDDMHIAAFGDMAI